MPLGGAHHGKRNARIARGRLDDGLPGFQRALLLRVVDDRKSQSVLYRRHRVERLYFDVHLDMTRPHAVETHDRRVADGLENVVVDHFLSFKCRP